MCVFTNMQRYVKCTFYTLRNNVIRHKSTMSNLVKVQTNQGIVVGKQQQLLNGSKYKYFKGIPYAQPPLGKLRFQSPLPIERFDTDELNCFEHRDKSVQKDEVTREVIGSENCLFLNVFVPDTDLSNLPVMVWIHGGGYHTGGNSDSRLPLVLLEHNVIVVTVNYRLGVLGFLCYPEEGIWGNAGLKDQRLALQWVQENIAHFNGDKNNVTLFGESAGASCVQMHLYAKHANKLFHKAIMQSGTANMEWVFQLYPRYKTLRIADLLGCKSRNTNEIMEFMQSVASHEIIANTLKVLTDEEIRCGLPFPFKPVIEDEFSPDIFIDLPVEKALQQGDAVKMPVIVGYNSAEGIVMMLKALTKISEINNDLARYVPRNLMLTQEEKEAIEKCMRKFYFNGHQITVDLQNELVELLSDYHFNYSLLKAAHWHSHFQTRSPLYFYRFEYVGQNNMYKSMFKLEHLNGACHADELCYLFQNHETNLEANYADASITRKICSYWANFAHTGKPIDTCSPNPVIWNPVKQHSDDNDRFVLDYLAINSVSEMRQNPDERRVQFWNEIHRRHKATDFSLSSREHIEN